MSAYISGFQFGYGEDTNNRCISINIYFSGCSKEPKCPGCHNPHLWNKEDGVLMPFSYIREQIKNRSELAGAIVFLGGEPLDQEFAVLEIAILAQELHLDTYLYTGWEIEEVPETIRNIINVIISGPYIQELANPAGVWPASSNQVITKKWIY